MPENDGGGPELGPGDVRQRVADELLAGPDEQPQPELVAERPARHEQPGLVAEQVGDPRARAR